MEGFQIVSLGATPAENLSFVGHCHKLTLFMCALYVFPLTRSLKNKGQRNCFSSFSSFALFVLETHSYQRWLEFSNCLSSHSQDRAGKVALN